MSMSKRLRRCTSGSKITSSSQVVLDDEDLLTLILLHVPGKNLMSLKCVSRKWHSVITASHFIHLRNSLPVRASGLFIQRPLSAGVSNEVYFVPLDDQNASSPFRNITFAHDPVGHEEIRILQSCNGLLLCSTAIYKPTKRRNCYVYNPSTNALATLPKHPLSRAKSGFCHIGLSFDPSKSVHYKVIAFLFTSQSPSENVGNFHIYSSETGTWKASVQSFTPAPGMNFLGGVYWNGCVHWLSDLMTKSEPESSLSDCLYFNVEEERLETFPRPPIGVRSSSRRSLYFGQSEDHLHVIEIRPGATSLGVYEMKNDYSEWFVKYEIDLDPISKVFPEIKDEAISEDQKGDDYAVDVLSLIRRENFLEDSFLVLEIPGKAIRYNLVDRSFKLIRDFAMKTGLENLDRRAFGRLNAWQYIESLSYV
ncbi:F-box domain containing protein [Heracleum sosnowskyi]|uniref:F-box domain containing protein n=1 Tax=Heracleum sosnowskyi TaxID=360622 RepID=A0AAD8H9E8_9APIA|nr:F-box domain containing protein [Heracleum sosnowskyi]